MRQNPLESKLEYKKAVLLVVGVTLLIALFFVGMLVVFFYGAKTLEGAEPKNLPGFKTYHSKRLGITFDYLGILKVQEKNGVVTLEHSVPFEHYDPCDRASGTKKSKRITDFYLTLQVVNESSDQILKESINKIENGAVLGFKEIDHIEYGGLRGFRLYNGNHGCGPYTYFFQFSEEKGYLGFYHQKKYLQVERYPAPEFHQLKEEEKQMYSHLRLIILPEQEEHIFRSVLTSLKWEDAR